MSGATAEMYEYEPDQVLAPGATLREWLSGHEMSQAELARRTGLSTKHISQVVNGVAGLSPEVAIAFESVTGIPARYWLQIESIFRAHAARKAEDQALAEQVDILAKFPVKELVRRRAIDGLAEPVEQLRELLKFFGVATVDALEGICLSDARLRTSRAFAPDEASLASWLRLAELDAQDIAVAHFDQKGCESAIEDFRSYSRMDGVSWLGALTQRCATVGIALVVVKELPKCRVNGATRWLTPNKAMIALSLRHRRHDVVWFTFFHELGHLLRHSRKRTFVDAAGSQVAADLELDADRFASRILVPPEYEAALGHVTTPAEARDLADRLGVDVGIVVGRLQHENLIPYSKWNTLIRTYRLHGD